MGNKFGNRSVSNIKLLRGNTTLHGQLSSDDAVDSPAEDTGKFSVPPDSLIAADWDKNSFGKYADTTLESRIGGLQYSLLEQGAQEINEEIDTRDLYVHIYGMLNSMGVGNSRDTVFKANAYPLRGEKPVWQWLLKRGFIADVDGKRKSFKRTDKGYALSTVLGKCGEMIPLHENLRTIAIDAETSRLPEWRRTPPTYPHMLYEYKNLFLVGKIENEYLDKVNTIYFTPPANRGNFTRNKKLDVNFFNQLKQQAVKSCNVLEPAAMMPVAGKYVFGGQTSGSRDLMVTLDSEQVNALAVDFGKLQFRFNENFAVGSAQVPIRIIQNVGFQGEQRVPVFVYDGKNRLLACIPGEFGMETTTAPHMNYRFHNLGKIKSLQHNIGII